MQPHWTNGIASLYHADAREIPLTDKSVHMCVTSPPYWGLRDYGLAGWEGGSADCDHEGNLLYGVGGSEKQRSNLGTVGGNVGTCTKCGAHNSSTGIGLEPTLGEWVDNIVAVGREVWRVLRDDGTFWLNLGDAYAGSGKGHSNDTNPGISKSFYRNGDTRQAVARDDLPAKNLMGQPWRVARALQEDGAASISEMHAIQRAIDAIWDTYDGVDPPDKVLNVLERMHNEYAQAKGNSWILRSAIVWHKPNPMPESVTDRPTNAYEMVFLFAKQQRYFYDGESIRQPQTEGTIARFGNGGAPHVHRSSRSLAVQTVRRNPSKNGNTRCYPPERRELSERLDDTDARLSGKSLCNFSRGAAPAVHPSWHIGKGRVRQVRQPVGTHGGNKNRQLFQQWAKATGA